jgi:hypothetical protein
MWHCEVYDENGLLAMELDIESPSWRNGRAPECVNVDVLRIHLAYVRWPRDGDTPTAIYYMRER